MLDTTTTTQIISEERQPYKGLAAYDPDDAHNFFGRETETQILLGKIFSFNTTVLFAGTGTGKSSLLRAGVLPKLTDDHHLDVVYYADWVQDPVAGLKKAVQRLLVANARVSGPELHGVAELYPFLKLCAAYASDPLVLMFDQFEELFQYHARSSRLLSFVEQIAQVVNAPELPVSLVFGMREDFLAELNIFKGRIPSLFDNYYRLEELQIEQARDAIEKPLKKISFRYEDGLVDQLLDDLAAREQEHQPGTTTPAAPGQEAARVVEPPYLQIVCNELWRAEKDNPQKVITMARYNSLGRTTKIVRKHFEQAMTHFSLREQCLAVEMFRYLVTERGTKMAYRAEDLASEQLLGVPVGELLPILNYLASKEVRVLRADQRLDQTWYELYHDVFVQIIRTWSEQFQADEDRRIYRQISSAVRKWVNADRDETLLLRGAALLESKDWQKRNRVETLAPDEQAFLKQSLTKYARGLWLRRGIVVVIALFAVISTIAGLYANVQWKEAKHHSRVALIRSLVAYALQNNIEEDRERAALLARHAYLLNQRYHGNVQSQIDTTLRTIFHTAAITKTEELANPVLGEQICQRVKLKIALTPDEWQLFTGNVLPYEPACPELSATAPLSLRHQRMITVDRQALALNLTESGEPIRNVDNKFDEQGEVIIDKATGLMWQKAGSSKALTYNDAEAYIKKLNREKFAGYADWRLPTIEELLSLLEVRFFMLTTDSFTQLKAGDPPVPEDVVARLQPLANKKMVAEQDFSHAVQQQLGEEDTLRYRARILEQAKNKYSRYINPMFNHIQSWVWSADIYQTKDENLVESVWVITFSKGIVGWATLRRGVYVRGVRSWQ